MQNFLIMLIFAFGFGQIYPVRISDKACLSADKALDPANQRAESCNGVNWENEIVDSGCYYNHNDFIFNSIALDTNNIPNVVYNKNLFSTIIFASRSDSNWQKEVVDSGLFYYGFSLIFDNNNTAHLSYYRKDDSLNKTYLCYARREEAGWITEVVDSKTGSLGNWFWHYNSSIDLDTSGLPGIAYVAWNIEDSIQYIKYAHYNDTGWDTSIVEYDSLWTGWGPSDWCPSLKFDSNNRSHIALYQCSWGTNDSLKYYYCDNLNNWIIDWVTYLGPAGGTFSLELALSSEGYPNIAYDYDGSLAYTWWDGVSWHTDYIILVGWDGVDIHLDVDSFDRPHIAYLPDQNGRPYYCYKDSIWHLCGPIEPDTSYKTFQEDISFALDDNDRPCVSYPFYKYVGYSISGIKYAKGTFTGIEEASSKIPEPGYALQVYPNPSRGIANIAYALHEHSEIALSIYDVAGVMVKQIKQGYLVPGYYQEKIDTRNLSSGVYFVVLKQDNDKVSKKFLIVK
jgi:hypothetical protein